MLDDLSLMYVSCITYKNLWEPFIKLKEKYLGSEIKMFLCTDEITEDLKHKINNFKNIDILSFDQKSVFLINGNLFDRYLYYLNKISSNYILYFYDDMFPINNIDLCKIQKLIDIMNCNKNIKLIKLSLYSYPFTNGKEIEYNNIQFVKADNKLDDYLFNVQPLLIRKDIFIDLVNYCKINNTCSHQNGGLEIFGTKFLKNNEHTVLRVKNEIIQISSPMGIVQSGILSEEMKKNLFEKENIHIDVYENNLIYKLTLDEYNCLGERLKEEYIKLGINYF